MPDSFPRIRARAREDQSAMRRHISRRWTVFHARSAAAFMVSCCLVSPDASLAQQSRTDRSAALFVLSGGVAGAGLALAYVIPPAEGWLVSDEAAFPIGVAAGLAAALTVRVAARNADPSAARSPRLRVDAGAGGKFDLDCSLGYRQPLGDRSELDAAILISSDTWERHEVETRCDPILGCITGTFLTAYSYQQSVTVLVRGIRHLAATSAWSPTIFVGAGPTVMRSESQDRSSRHTGLTLDGGLGVERGRRYRWTAVIGVRAIPLGSVDEATIDEPSWYVRIGVAWAG